MLRDPVIDITCSDPWRRWRHMMLNKLLGMHPGPLKSIIASIQLILIFIEHPESVLEDLNCLQCLLPPLFAYALLVSLIVKFLHNFLQVQLRLTLARILAWRVVSLLVRGRVFVQRVVHLLFIHMLFIVNQAWLAISGLVISVFLMHSIRWVSVGC